METTYSIADLTFTQVLDHFTGSQRNGSQLITDEFVALFGKSDRLSNSPSSKLQISSCSFGESNATLVARGVKIGHSLVMERYSVI